VLEDDIRSGVLPPIKTVHTAIRFKERGNFLQRAAMRRRAA
jgi:hypothetical protein